ncbi:hypothetical protein BY458DRAFT_513150 [Sporodiniella umbellata]|nr:hypothetical protein BY458DRAFT_513150 [Sporodiniella umbellata]
MECRLFSLMLFCLFICKLLFFFIGLDISSTCYVRPFGSLGILFFSSQSLVSLYPLSVINQDM